MAEITKAIQTNFSDFAEPFIVKGGTLPNIRTDFSSFGNKAEAVAKENKHFIFGNW